jgi:predicted DNA-binding WGR domain protein
MMNFSLPILFLKATTTKTITVPGYTRHDGVFVPPHSKVVHYDPVKSAQDVLSGNGSHSQKVALKKLKKLGSWDAMPEDDKHAHILSAATNHQKKASASAALSGWKSSMKAGMETTPAQQAAFDALPPEKKDALLAEVGAKPALVAPKQEAPSPFPSFADHAKADADAEAKAKAESMGAWSYIKEFGGTLKTAEDWLAAHPLGEGELASALVDAGKYEIAKLMGIYTTISDAHHPDSIAGNEFGPHKISTGMVLHFDSAYAKMNAGDWKVYNVSKDGAFYYLHRVGAKVPNQNNTATIPAETLHAALDNGTAWKDGDAKPHNPLADKGAPAAASSDDLPIVSTGMAKVKDEFGGTSHLVSFSDGSSASIVKLNSSESMGLPGWHNADGSAFSSYLGDTKEDAVAELIKQKEKAAAKKKAAGASSSAPSSALDDWAAFKAKHSEDVESFEDISPFLKDPKMAGPAALSAFSSSSFSEINSAPDHPASKALLSFVSKLPPAAEKNIYRVLGFDGAAAAESFVADMKAGGVAPNVQKRTLTSWTAQDPAAPGQTPMNNIALDLASSHGEHRVFLSLAGPSSGKDISFVYGAVKPGAEVVLPKGTALDVVSVKKSGKDTHIEVREVHEGDTKPAADGGVLVLKDGHWVKQGGPEASAPESHAVGDMVKINAMTPDNGHVGKVTKVIPNSGIGGENVTAYMIYGADGPYGHNEVDPVGASPAGDAGEATLAHKLVEDQWASLSAVPASGVPAVLNSYGYQTGVSIEALEDAYAGMKLSDLAAGTGGHYPVKAAKKLSSGKGFSDLPGKEALQQVLELAKQMQAAASASAAVSGWKKAALAGKAPTNAQLAAFQGLPPEKKKSMLAAVSDAVGSLAHLAGTPAIAGYNQDPAPAPDSPSVVAPSAAPKVVKVTAATTPKVPASVKKLQAIDPAAVSEWLDDATPGKKSAFALSIFDAATAPGKKKFLKWHNASQKYGVASHWKKLYRCAAICSLYGKLDMALLDDGTWRKVEGVSVAETDHLVTDPAKIQAAVIAEKMGAPAAAGTVKALTSNDVKSVSNWFQNAASAKAKQAAMNGSKQGVIDAYEYATSKSQFTTAGQIKKLALAMGFSIDDGETDLASPPASPSKPVPPDVGSEDHVYLQWISNAIDANEPAHLKNYISSLESSIDPASAVLLKYAKDGLSFLTGVADEAPAVSAQHHFMGSTFTKVGDYWKTSTSVYGPGGWMHTALSVLNGDEVSPAVPDNVKGKALEALLSPGSGVSSKVTPTHALNALFPPSDGGPHEGDTKTIGGVTYVLQGGRWHKQGEDAAASPAPAVSAEPLLWSSHENTSEGHSKFWNVATDGTKLITHYGKIGSKGTFTVKEFPSIFGAAQAAADLTAKKMKGGYKEVGTKTYAMEQPTSPAPIGGAPVATAVIGGKKIVGAHVPADSVTPMVADGWVQTGAQGGFNDGGVFKDPDGVEWYLKFPAGGEDVVKNELLAGKLYALAGLPFPDTRIVVKDGKVGHASKMVAGLKKDKAALEAGTAPGLLSGFAVDAWLANWDTVGNNPAPGKGYDNIQIGPDGHAYRIDAGGSLLYGGAGGKKAGFGDTVVELKTMLNPSKNAHTAAVFGKMGTADITASVAKVAAITDEQIKAAVDKYGPGSASAKAKLAATLIARKADMLEQYPQAAKAKPAPVIKKKPSVDHTALPDPRKLKVDPAKLIQPHDFMNWQGSGKPISDKPYVQQNIKDETALFEAAKKGDLISFAKYKFQPVDKMTGAPTGDLLPIDQHPSAHVKSFYGSLLDALNVIANPGAKKVAEWYALTVGSVGQLDDYFPAHKYGESVSTVPADERLGFWISLGKIGNWSSWVPKAKPIKALSGADKKAAHSYTSQLKSWLLSVKGSGGANQPYRDGKEFDSNGSFSRSVLSDAYELGRDEPAGSTIYKWINFNSDMLKLMTDADPGLVFQNPGSMCCSMADSKTSGFGHHRLTIRYAEGAKALPNYGLGSGYDSSEAEITTIPGVRFMLISTKLNEHGHGRHDFELLMLPPDPSYIADVEKKTAAHKAGKDWKNV